MIYRWERVGLRTERYELLYRRLGLAEAVPARPAQSAGAEAGSSGPRDAGAEREAKNVLAWIAGTNASDDAIAEIARAASYLAEVHTRVAAGKVLTEEAQADEAIAWSVKAKTAQWQNRFVESAELARRGFEVSGPTPTRVELAYREANAIALFGDVSRARQALQRAERAAETVACDGSAPSVWSFPAVRQAIFSLSIAIYTGDAAAALRGAAAADASWRAGEPKVPATWAQVRAGAAMAFLMTGSLDGAAAELAPMLDLAPDLRIGTVTGYLVHLDRMLGQRRYADSHLAADLRQQIRKFSSAAAA